MTPAGSRVVLVLGGTSGIGLAAARQLAERGDTVVVSARDELRCQEVAARLPGAHAIAADVADGASVAALVDRVVADHGRLDGVVLTAQVMAYGTVEQVPEDVFETILDTAVLGAFHVARAVLPQFRRQRGGALVVVSSLLAEIPVPSMSSYCAAKWGQLGLVRSLQMETRRERGIGVSLVLPGAIDTPIYAQAATYAGRGGHAPPPVISPERVARACVAALDRPRRQVHVGPANRVAVLGYRLTPWLYDRLAVPLAGHVVLRGRRVPDDPGNVLSPVRAGEGLRGGWSLLGRRRATPG